ncbi:MAG: TIGR02452 family protein [Roseivirga sp.]|nr:TIGR02452 family protein [Roseivirga sp.]
MKKSTRKIKAEETLRIIKEGKYISQNTVAVSVEDGVNNTLKHTEVFSSEALELLGKSAEENPDTFNTTFEVIEEDVVSCIHRVSKQHKGKVMCLNFASAKNPGGGFLNGAVAQEESLALSSNLYDSQTSTIGYYDLHRGMKSCVYTDTMIYSPQVLFFRNFKGELVDEPTLCNIVTSAAVNTGVVLRKEPQLKEAIPDLMGKRIEKLLTLSKSKKNDMLILGAWGCGVFQNDPNIIANLFKERLEGMFKNQFEHIVFAVYSRDKKFIEAFQRVFV